VFDLGTRVCVWFVYDMKCVRYVGMVYIWYVYSMLCILCMVYGRYVNGMCMACLVKETGICIEWYV
jgi:hypothetical protein